ncbi:hypothetical protein PIIN_11650 [Serendipita indica DSM 11827]|uniref:Uncharacterized protein n=1 Tax=Serendipita indica (strain DSM 11827) TaxID=1109443 RepID=G4U279_SERID|nr:hypothetical protein PIIN_11650 [Serendipita indica DSM 11827]
MVEDWYYWMRRFREICDLGGVSEATRALAGRTAAAMEGLVNLPSGS